MSAANGQPPPWATIELPADPPAYPPAPKPSTGLTAPRPAQRRRHKRPKLDMRGHIPGVAPRHWAAAATVALILLALVAIGRIRPNINVTTPDPTTTAISTAQAFRADIVAEAAAAAAAAATPVIVQTEALSWSPCPLTGEARTMIGTDPQTGVSMEPTRAGAVERQVQALMAVGVPLERMRLTAASPTSLTVVDGGGGAGAALFRCTSGDVPAPTTTGAQ